MIYFGNTGIAADQIAIITPAVIYGSNTIRIITKGGSEVRYQCLGADIDSKLAQFKAEIEAELHPCKKVSTPDKENTATVQTPLGALTAVVGEDDNPGIHVKFRPKGKNKDILLAVVEYGDRSTGLAARVYGNEHLQTPTSCTHFVYGVLTFEEAVREVRRYLVMKDDQYFDQRGFLSRNDFFTTYPHTDALIERLADKYVQAYDAGIGEKTDVLADICDVWFWEGKI